MSRSRVRLWFIVMSLLLIATMVGGCAPQPTQAPPAEPTEKAAEPKEEPEPEQEPITIVMWHWKFGQPAFKEWTDWLKRTFEADHPNVTLEYYQPAELGPEVQTAIAAQENVPDFVGVGGEAWETAAAEAGRFLDLTDYINSDSEWHGWVEGWSAVPKAQYTYKDQIIKINITNGPNFIYYRKDIFEQAGVEPPETFDELMALPSAFEAIGVDTMVSGLDSTTLWQYQPWFYSIAGTIDYEWALARQADECQPWSGDPVAKEALETFQKVYDEGVLRKQSPQEKYDPDAKQAILQGDAAMLYTGGVWLNAGFGDDIDKVGAMYWPALDKDSNHVLMGSNDVAVAVLSVTEGQKDPARQAIIVELAKFMCSPASQEKIWEVGLMPLMPEAVTAEETDAQKLTADQIRKAASPDVDVLYYLTQIPEVGRALGDGMLGLLLDVKTPDEVLADIDAACAAR